MNMSYQRGLGVYDPSKLTFNMGGTIGVETPVGITATLTETTGLVPNASADPCWGDPTNWSGKKGSDGKCYWVCNSNQSVGYEVDASDCSGLPTWALWAGGAAAMLLFLMISTRD